MDTPKDEQVVQSPESRRQVRLTFCLTFAFYAIQLIPILWGNRYHLEDWRRLIRGSYGWTGEGRPLTDVLLRILCLGGPLVDLSPIPQILGIAALAGSASWMARRFGLPPLRSALALFPLAASPFFLENLSFRFDAVAMCAALALAILPIGIDNLRSFTVECALGTVCLLLSLCSYQTGICAYFVFAVAEIGLLCQQRVEFKNLVRKLSLRTVQLIIAGLAYALVVRFTVVGDYNVEHVRLVSSRRDLHVVVQNWRDVWSSIYHALPGSIRNIYLIVWLLGTLALIFLGLSYARASWLRGERFSASLVTVGILLLPGIWLVGAVGPVLLPLHSNLTLPRIFVGVGALLSSSLFVFCLMSQRLAIPGQLISALLVVPAYPLLMLAALFGNVQREQASYENRIASELTSAINTVRRTNVVSSLIVDGVVPYCPAAQIAEKKYRILRVPRNLTSDRELGIYAHHVFEYYGIDLPSESSPERRAELVRRTTQTKPLVQNGDYDLFLVDRTLIVRFFGDSGVVYPGSG